jgi:hypothetical protein
MDRPRRGCPGHEAWRLNVHLEIGPSATTNVNTIEVRKGEGAWFGTATDPAVAS